ncbi:MAG: alpha-galactosidase [Sedimentisphaerales bacterium]|nr:alpha-galactosidase [Sedimentisphaerales bacterium]
MAENMRIENEYLTVEFAATGLSFSAASKASNMRFIERATLGEGAAMYHRRAAADETWGAGQVVEITHRSGRVDRVCLFEGVPFIVLRSTWANRGAEATTIDSIRPLSAVLDLGRPASELRALGTAGLTQVGQKANPGSYSFLAVADPDSRAGVVAGWVSHDRGSGVLFSDIRDDKVLVDARLDYGRLLLAPGGKADGETFVIGYFSDARLGLEAYADAVAKYYRIVLPPQPTVYCTWYHAGASNAENIAKNARFAREHLAPFGFSVVQIDDGWQAGEKIEGPRKDFTTHRAGGPYPEGMKPTADELKRLGLVPGIWFMPFAGTWDDPYFADKQDLFATRDGEPYVVRWGGTCFDLTHPKTLAYVRDVAHRIGVDWGYRYFKLDGLWTGLATGMCYVNTGFKDDELGSAVLHDPTKTHVEAYRDGLKAVREAAGKGLFILGCNMAQNMRVMGASFGLVEAMRVGPDNGRDWSRMCRGPFSGSNTYFLHGRVWYNDPDPIYVRDDVPLAHARALTSWVTLTGQLNASSTDYTQLSAERLHLLQRSMPAHGLKPRPVDLFEAKTARIWLLTDERGSTRRDVVGLFNWDDKQEAQIEYPLDKIGLPPSRNYVGFDYWANEFVDPFAGRSLKATLEPASCRILAIRPFRAVPQVVSTSRHITQGIVDLLEETWHEETNTLSGVSKVVGGDPYEIRIVASMGRPGNWKAGEAAVSAEDTAAGVKIELLAQDRWKVRVRIEAPSSRDVRWSIAFTEPTAAR